MTKHETATTVEQIIQDLDDASGRNDAEALVAPSPECSGSTSRVTVVALPPARSQDLGLTIPCIVSQLTKASNQPVLVVSFGYMPKP